MAMAAVDAMNWIERICERCQQPFCVKASHRDDVQRVNCSPCRQELGHQTAVKWPKDEIPYQRPGYFRCGSWIDAGKSDISPKEAA